MATNAAKTIQRAGHDAPITDHQQDRLGRLPVARNIHRLIVNAPEGWSTRVGLYGPWGEGKSSVLRLLRPLLEREDRRVGKGTGLVVELSVWNETSASQVLERIHDALDAKLSELVQVVNDPKLGQIFKDVWLAKISRFVRGNKERLAEAAGIASAVVTQVGVATTAAALTGTAATPGVPPGTAGATTLGHGLPPSVAVAVGAEAGKVANAVTKKSTAGAIDWITGPTDRRVREFIDKLREHGIHRVVVFIDDLDRADPKAVPHTLLALRELLDWPDFAFVLAFDREVIGEALQSYSASFGPRAKGFLEKIIDVPIDLPPPTPQAIERFALEELQGDCRFIPKDTRESVAKLFPANPRKVRSIVRSLAVLSDLGKRLSPEDIDWRGLILQLMFRHWAPKDVWHQVEKIWVGERFERSSAKEKTLDTDAKEAIHSLLLENKGSIGSFHDFERLCDLGIALFGQRRDTLQFKIDAEMAMLYAPPAFTFLEIEKLKNAGTGGDWGRPVSEALKQAKKRCTQSSSEIAGELFLAASSWYSSALNPQIEIEAHVPVAQAQRDSALCLMEYLWHTSTSKEIISARKDITNAEGVLNVLRAVANLNERQIQLAQKVISQGLDPVTLHRACTKDLINPEFKGTELSKLIEPSLLDWLLAALKRRDGLSDALAGDDNRGLHVSALFGAPWSPLFAVENRPKLLKTLIEMRSESTVEGLLIGASNAGQLLARLSLAEGDGSWAHGNRNFFEKKENNDFFKEAWLTYIAVNWSGQHVGRAEYRRGTLVEAGVPEQLLKVPPWMAQSSGNAPTEHNR